MRTHCGVHYYSIADSVSLITLVEAIIGSGFLGGLGHLDLQVDTVDYDALGFVGTYLDRLSVGEGDLGTVYGAVDVRFHT